MKIQPKQITVRELFDGYKDSGEDGVVAYKGTLDIRPAYQRELVYSPEQQIAVMDTVVKGFPLNVMYWCKNPAGAAHEYEVLDGQQRTLSIMRYLDHKYDIEYNGHRYYVDSLPDDVYDRIMSYSLLVYECEGAASEKLDWFRIVNIAGEVLTAQELRNSVYVGPWLTDAKRHFSKTNCAAYGLGSKLVKGNPIRQELLEKALTWISAEKGVSIEQYMSDHQFDPDCDELWTFYQNVINWVNVIFPKYDKLMLGLDWGTWYSMYRSRSYSPTKMAQEVSRLMADEDVTNKKGIYHYLLATDQTETEREKYLSIRSFDDRDKRSVYEQQRGICPICCKHYELIKMHADHIVPWSQGGRTTRDNLQMLCRDCNLKKSAQL